VRLFEFGTVFLGRKNGNGSPLLESPDGPAGGDAWAEERATLAGIWTGQVGAVAFDRERTSADFYDLKGLLEAFLTRLGLQHGAMGAALVHEPAEDSVVWLHPRSATRLILSEGKRVLGHYGELHPDLVQSAGGLKGPVLVFELNVQELADVVQMVPTAWELSRFPAVKRDLALIVDAALPAQRLSELVVGEGEIAPLLEGFRIFDVYQGKGIPEGKKSIAFSLTLRSSERTLTEEEVTSAMESLMQAARDQLGADIRA
jgi:phenylalanyl-tRNA synthetase beta chain